MSFNNKTIEELHDLLVSKEISATELTQATLDDIKAREEAVNAFVTVAEEAALAQAKAIDEKGIEKDNLLSALCMLPPSQLVLLLQPSSRFPVSLLTTEMSL